MKLEDLKVPDGHYAVLQMEHEIEGARERMFRSLEFLQLHNMKPEATMYKSVYIDRQPAHESREELLEDLFTKFNIYHPADFRGHSLSISDIIVLSEGGRKRYYYVQPIGFKELESFA